MYACGVNARVGSLCVILTLEFCCQHLYMTSMCFDVMRVWCVRWFYLGGFSALFIC